MIGIILSNFGFWFNLLIPFLVGLFFFLRGKEYTLEEFGLQIFGTVIIILIMYLILFSTTKDLDDKNYINSRLANVQYHEEWTELVTYQENYPCGKSTCTRTKTRHDYHPSFYRVQAEDSYQENITKEQFKNLYGKYVASVNETSPYRPDRISIGDGKIFYYYLNKDSMITRSESYINYVVAANMNILNAKVDENEIVSGIKSGNLLKYPELKIVNFEKGLTPRVSVSSGVKLEEKTLDSLYKQIYDLNLKYSSTKQANILLYITDQDRTFFETLRYYWKNGKKNDIIIVTSIDKGNNIVWTDVITYTDNINFVVDVQNIKGKIENILVEFEKVLPEFKRKPMEDFKYLSENIELDTEWNLLIILINLIFSAFAFRYFHKN